MLRMVRKENCDQIGDMHRHLDLLRNSSSRRRQTPETIFKHPRSYMKRIVRDRGEGDCLPESSGDCAVIG